MTERVLPTEGAPACPFVAFEDDRDGRSTAPDHRHRCFAEARPAPRALAHQEAYCLSSAFPVCPTFQDWARREAAAARPQVPSTGATRDEPPQSRPMPPLEREPRQLTDTPPPVPARRSQARDWAAPPPWADGDDPGPDGVPGAAVAAAGSGALWGPDVAGVADVPVVPPRDPGRGSSRQPAEWGSESRGLAGSPAYRMAGPDPDEPAPATPQRDDPDDAWADDDLDARDDAWATGTGAGAYVAGSATARTPGASRPSDDAYAPPPARKPASSRSDGRSRSGSPADAGNPARDQVHRAPPPDAQELFGPAWERPRRYEAYPTLRTRMGLPSLGGVPKVALWGIILLVGAVFLFLFGPGLLGLGGGDPGSDATPTPAASVEVTPNPEPTEPPAPTPQVYVVAKGDTMSKIAKKFDVTVEAIMEANPKIKNPDRIQIGDEITIPVPESDENGFVDDGATADGSTPEP